MRCTLVYLQDITELHGREYFQLKKTGIDAHRVMLHNLPGCGCYSSQYKQSSKLNALTVAQATLQLVTLSHA